MQGTPGHHAWSNVDETSDPSWFIRFLDASRRRMIAAAQQDPAAVYPWAHPGMRVLDVGCGTGVLLAPLVGLLGETGQVAGIDFSAALIAEARRRATENGSRIDFHIGDARALPFPDGSFDCAMANLLLQHLEAPGPALSELVRVVRPGGMVLIGEQDWDSLLIDHSNRSATRRIVHNFCDAVPNGWIGRQLAFLLAQAGLVTVTVSGVHYSLPSEEWMDPAFGFREIAEQARRSDAITAEEQNHWEAELAERIRSGAFHAGFVMFRASGTRPPGAPAHPQ